VWRAISEKDRRHKMPRIVTVLTREEIRDTWKKLVRDNGGPVWFYSGGFRGVARKPKAWLARYRKLRADVKKRAAIKNENIYWSSDGQVSFEERK
jgi:hypothetical protein